MTITVTQLNNYIRGLFEMDGVLGELSVCGEITNVKRAREGWYFSLKDDGGAINCFCYGSNANEPVTGTVAVVEGNVNYFVRTGSVSLFARRVTATTNTGAAYLKFIELKEKLQKEGLFDEDRKKQVPHCARKIGIVTSETGAVIRDIHDVSLRRQPFTNLILYPVKVQGVGAEQEIAEGIAYFNNSDVDVVIVGRGGGSNEDLSVFNSETVVRAVANCNKPVVSAVGHGIDFTLCDFAADKRAVTPSEAAEFVTLDVEREKVRLRAYLDKISSNISSKLDQNKQRIVYDCKVLQMGIDKRLGVMQNRVVQCLSDIENSAKHKYEQISVRLDKTANKLSTLNPASILKRGYGYVSAENGVVKSVNQVKVGSNVQIQLQDGKLDATVTRKEANKK
ncbi:MAG: exodeoxyribonuclease VII large subunit [Clostridiales bacterium]|nr:exodeoxyribonuclease VII large subunit [Clostridiales bacterium]